MKPTRCTLLLSIFISTSLHVSGNYVSIIRGTYCIYVTLVFFTHWMTLDRGPIRFWFSKAPDVQHVIRGPHDPEVRTA